MQGPSGWAQGSDRCLAGFGGRTGHRLSTVVLVLALAGFAVGTVQAGGAQQVLLRADFQDQPVDQPIGVGGAALGQPSFVFPFLDAIVRDAPMATRALEITWAAPPSTTSTVTFGLLDDQQVSTGQLTIEMTWLPHVDSGYAIAIREADGASHMFGGLNLTPTGVLRLHDATGSVAIASEVASGEAMHLRWDYDMDAGTYRFHLDGELMLADRAHGVSAKHAGIGRVMVGLDWGTRLDTALSIDDLIVSRPPPDPIFAHGFE